MVRIVDLRQLQCFVTVAAEGSFSKAADRLNMTQPPLSRQLKNLERFLGIDLFRRTTRSVQLTHAGREFLPEANRLLRLAEHVTLQGQRLTEGTAGVVRLGFTASSAYSFVPALISRCRTEFPGLDLALRDMPTQDQIEGLFSGQIDVGFLRTPSRPPGVNIERLIREPFVVALPRGHRLSRRRKLHIKQLVTSEVIMYSPLWDPYFHSLITSLFQSGGINPNIAQYVTQVHSVLALVEAGLGIGFVPQSALSLGFSGIDFCELQEECGQHVDLFMAWRKEQDLPILSTFTTFTRAFATNWTLPNA